MAPTMPVSAPLAGGSKNAIAPCVATRSLRMRCVSVACSPGVATSSRQRTEPTCQDSCSKEKLPGILTASSCLTSGYQLSNEHFADTGLLCIIGELKLNHLGLRNRQDFRASRLHQGRVYLQAYLLHHRSATRCNRCDKDQGNEAIFLDYTLLASQQRIARVKD